MYKMACRYLAWPYILLITLFVYISRCNSKRRDIFRIILFTYVKLHRLILHTCTLATARKADAKLLSTSKNFEKRQMLYALPSSSSQKCREWSWDKQDKTSQPKQMSGETKQHAVCGDSSSASKNSGLTFDIIYTTYIIVKTRRKELNILYVYLYILRAHSRANFEYTNVFRNTH